MSDMSSEKRCISFPVRANESTEGHQGLLLDKLDKEQGLASITEIRGA